MYFIYQHNISPLYGFSAFPQKFNFCI